MKLACDQYYIDSERNPTGGIVGRTPNNERRYVNMAVTGIGTYASYTNSYGNTQNAGNKTGRTYKNAHEYKNYLTQKYDCLRSRDYSVNINSSLLSKAMGDEKTKQWLEYNLSLIPKTIEQSRAYVAAGVEQEEAQHLLVVVVNDELAALRSQHNRVGDIDKEAGVCTIYVRVGKVVRLCSRLFALSP